MGKIIRILIQIILLPLLLPLYLLRQIRSLRIPRRIAVSLAGPLEETPPRSGLAELFKEEQQSYYDLIYHLWYYLKSVDQKKIKTAAEKGVKPYILDIRVKSPAIGWARAAELRQLVQQYRKAGFVTRAFLHSGESMSWYIASAAEKVYMPPAQTLFLTGLSIENTYLKGLFDKYGIVPEFITTGKYKSAAEMFTRKKGSPAAKEQLQKILDEIFTALKGALQERDLSEKQTESVLKTAVFSPAKAVEAGLLDQVAYSSEATDLLKSEFKKPGRAKKLSAAITRLERRHRPLIRFKKPKRVALVTGQGPIIDVRETVPKAINLSDYLPAFREIAEDDYADIILRWNSPGGSAYTSDILWREIMKLSRRDALENDTIAPFKQNGDEPGEKDENTSALPKKVKNRTKKKKTGRQPGVYVSQSDVAASGGYYLSAVNKNIYTGRLTITGSIGVIFGKFSIRGLLSRAEISTDSVSAGEHGGIFSPFQKFTATQKKILRENIEDMYALFRNRISLGRDMPDETVKKLGGGRVYTGGAALKNGLADHEGSLSDLFELIFEKNRLSHPKHLLLEVHPRLKVPLLSKPNPLGALQNALALGRGLSRGNFYFIDERFF